MESVRTKRAAVTAEQGDDTPGVDIRRGHIATNNPRSWSPGAVQALCGSDSGEAYDISGIFAYDEVMAGVGRQPDQCSSRAPADRYHPETGESAQTVFMIAKTLFLAKIIHRIGA
jgi:hypothetical protein